MASHVDLDMVTISFGKPVDSIGFTPELAEHFMAMFKHKLAELPDAPKVP